MKKKTNSQCDDDLLEEYDFSQGMRGKYAGGETERSSRGDRDASPRSRAHDAPPPSTLQPPRCLPGSITLGIDPGLNRTGYAVFERTSRGPILREGGVIRSTQKLSLAERVLEIGQGLREVFDQFQPQVMAIEQVFSSVQYPKTALLMAHARGTILYAAAERGVQVVHYMPRQIKRLLTGSGKASKDQVQRAIQNELKLDRLLEPNDVADAAAVALCHYYTARANVAVGRSA